MRNQDRKICKVFSKNLQYYMDLYGEDRQELADALHFKYSTISNWLSCYSYASEDKIKELADHFGISKYQLTEENNQRPEINASFEKRKELNEITASLNDDELDLIISLANKIKHNK